MVSCHIPLSHIIELLPFTIFIMHIVIFVVSQSNSIHVSLLLTFRTETEAQEMKSMSKIS